MKENGDKSRKNKIIVALFALLPILLVVLFFYAYRQLTIDLEEDEGKKSPTEIVKDKDGLQQFDLEGEIYLTLNPVGEIATNVYRLDLATFEMHPVFEKSGDLHYMASFSPDLDKMLFVRVYGDGESKILFLEDGVFNELTPQTRFFERNPVFSQDGEYITYWTQTSLGEPTAPEDFDIYVVSLEGKQEKIAQGALPLFSPGGDALLFLKSDGLYRVDIMTKEEKLVLEIEDFSEIDEDWDWASLRFNVSQEKNLLILTDTLGFNNAIYKIKSWDSFELEFLDYTPLWGANWPVFSPCGNYLVVQNSDPVLAPLAQVTIFHLEGEDFQEVKSMDLHDYDLFGIWITDWIVK